MKLKILSKKQNPLIKRMEVAFRIDHHNEGSTPSRVEIRKQIALLLKTKIELVYIKKVETKTGTMVAVGEANIYDAIEQAELVEPKHIIARNAISKEPEEPKATKEVVIKEEAE